MKVEAKKVQQNEGKVKKEVPAKGKQNSPQKVQAKKVEIPKAKEDSKKNKDIKVGHK
jgi:uncharacterized cupredoxin-like copper-binding protein